MFDPMKDQPTNALEEIDCRIAGLEHRIATWHAKAIAQAEEGLARVTQYRDEDVAYLETWRAVKKRLS